jgi:flagellar basal body P-ring formation protein FlgA
MNLRPALSILLPCLLALLLCTDVQAAGEGVRAEVRVAAETVTRGERLTLGDIAEVASSDAATVERLRAVALGYSPNVGAIRELTREKIQLSIAAAGFSAEAVTLHAPKTAIIKRASQAISPELIREAVERVALAGFHTEGASAKLVRLDLPHSIEVPSGTVEARASLGKIKDYLSPFTVSIELVLDGRVVRRLSATAQIEAQAPVLVAASDLAARTRLSEESVRVELRILDRQLTAYLRDAARLRGAALTRGVLKGDPLTVDAVYPEIIVKAGDPVRILGQSGSLSLNVAGEARAAGRAGDRIQVKNLQSGVLLQAIVVDEGLVRVRF